MFRVPSILLCAIMFLAMNSKAHAEPNIMFIIDASGSMKEKIDGETRMSVAKEVMNRTLKDLPKDANLGLLAYGHRKAKDCTDIELIAPLGSETADTVGKTIQGFNAKGETPIAESMTKAAKSFKAFKGQQNSIILVTDGLEECKGDPCAAAKELKDAGLDIKVNIVGFTLGDEDAKKLKCVTETTGGQYYSAANASDLTKAMQEVQKQAQETVIVDEAKKPSFDGNLLASENGGKLEYAPNKNWQHLTGDLKKMDGAAYTGEGVWSFKDGKAATFDQIEVLVPKAYNYNLKDFEILASDSLNEPYRSLGEFSVKNVKMMPEGWQGFKFPETTAHFVKIIFKNGQNGHVNGNALKLMGSIVEDSETIKKPEPSNGIDLLAQKNGGTLVSGANDQWALINGKPDNFKGPTYSGEGIWSFKDRKSATFDRAKIMVSRTYDYNLKDFEILASDNAEGPFKSLGEFSLGNFVVMPDGWQTFTFPETTAHFIKFNFINGQNGHISGHPIQVIGTINEESESAPAPFEPSGEDLIAQSNGGSLLYGQNDEWNKLNSSNGERATVRVGEGVWSFKDEMAATINAVQILVPKKNQYNLKDFEILVGNDGPTGDFRSLGQFTVSNTKAHPDGWQTFQLPETDAKFVKLVTKNDQGGGYIAMYGFKVYGTLESE